MSILWIQENTNNSVLAVNPISGPIIGSKVLGEYDWPNWVTESILCPEIRIHNRKRSNENCELSFMYLPISQSALQHYIVSLHIHNSGSPKLLILLRHIQVLDLPPIISSTYISIGLVAHLQHLAKLNKKSLQFHTHPPPLFLNHFWANTPLLRKPSEF